MRVTYKALAAIGITVLFWASAFAGIRAALSAYSPGHLALLRLLVASVVLAGYAAYTRMRLPEKRDLPAMLLLGALGFAVYHVALNYGEQTVTAGAASFLIATAPVFVAILAVVFLGERFTMWGWLGILVSLAGAGLIAFAEAGGMRLDRGAWLVLLAALVAAVYIVLQKSYLKKYRPLELTTYTIWAGTLLLLVFLPGFISSIQTAPMEATLSVIYLGIFPTALAYVTYAYVLSQMEASVAGSLLYLVPVLAVPIAWVWLGELPNPMAVIGGLIALAGVILVNRYGGSDRTVSGRKAV